mgnify:CR=1 FL=1
MLQDKDRIFTNLYGMHDRSLAGAKKRGHWDGTALVVDTITRIDPATNTVQARLPAPTGSSAVRAGFGSLWVTAWVEDSVPSEARTVRL